MTNPFVFRVPDWANKQLDASSAEDALARAWDLSRAVYPLGVQSGIHSMIEWCGVMGEYVKMLTEAHEQGLDPREVDQHHAGSVVTVPDYMVEYFCEKLGCQLKPFIRGTNKATWRRHIIAWFEEEAVGAQNDAISARLRDAPQWP